MICRRWKNQTNLRIRLHLVTDGGTTEDGWYVDDLSVTDNGAAVMALPFYEGFENGLSNWLHSAVGGGHQRAVCRELCGA